MADRYEEIARHYIEGVGGLFDLYRYEMAVPKCTPPEVEGARWMLMTLTNPKNRELLDQLVEQSELTTREWISSRCSEKLREIVEESRRLRGGRSTHPMDQKTLWEAA